MSKHRRTFRPLLVRLESRESPTNLLGLGTPFAIGAAELSAVQPSS